MSSALRLYTAYASSVLLRTATPSRFRSVGLLIPGEDLLKVAVGRCRAFVRPGTNDLDILSPAHEPLATQWLHTSPGAVVVDVGAHIGRYTLLAATSAEKVIAVEPDPDNFELLSMNVSVNEFANVVLLPVAASRRKGTMRFWRAPSENTGTSSLLEPRDSAPGSEGGVIHVACDTLDSLLNDIDTDRIDWLKIDVEGHERDVLEGAVETLSRTSRIILEVTDESEPDCKRVLERLGFTVAARDRGYPARNLLFIRGTRGE